MPDDPSELSATNLLAGQAVPLLIPETIGGFACAMKFPAANNTQQKKN